jgi:predicted 3-demethylubiquinone-9 3-methyltransferase (glyoxalase superfamily)
LLDQLNGSRLTIALGACQRRNAASGLSASTRRIEESTMQPRVQPFLMFQGNNAEEAMRFYVSLFPDGEVLEIARYGPGGPGAEGSVKTARFSISKQIVKCIDSPVKHAFTFTPALSLFVDCESEDEIRRLSTALAEGGAFLMPLGSYGFSRQFAWLNDRFGVSWQLNLA